MMEFFGPNLERVYIVKGDAATNANRKAVLSQAIMEGVVAKNSAEVFATAAKESHCCQLAAVEAGGKVVLSSQLTYIQPARNVRHSAHAIMLPSKVFLR